MPEYRESLRARGVSKRQRFIKYVSNLMLPDTRPISRPRVELLNMLRKGQRFKAFLQPATMNIRDHTTRAQKYFNRLISSISKYVKDLRTGKVDSFLDLSGIRNPAIRFRKALETLIERSKERIVEFARKIIDKAITPVAFMDSVGREIRKLFIQSAFLGVRGIGNITGNVLENVIARTDKALNFIQDFASEITETYNRGVDLTQKQAQGFLYRIERYVSAAKAVASDAERNLIQDTYGGQGDDEVYGMRILGSTDNHCLECPDLAGEWQPASDVVPIGQTLCQHSCYCTIRWARLRDINPLELESSNAFA